MAHIEFYQFLFHTYSPAGIGQTMMLLIDCVSVLAIHAVTKRSKRVHVEQEQCQQNM